MEIASLGHRRFNSRKALPPLLPAQDLLQMVSIQESLGLDNLALPVPAAVPRVVLLVGLAALNLSVDRLHLNDGPAVLADNDALLAARHLELIAGGGEQRVNVGPGGVVVVLFARPRAREAVLARHLPVHIVVDVVEELASALGRVVEVAEDVVNVLTVRVARHSCGSRGLRAERRLDLLML